MFESNQFYVLDPVSGISVLSTDPETMIYYNVILAMAAITLIGSLLYYFTVLLAEVVGHVPNFIRILCASKKSGAQKHISAVGEEDNNRGESDDMIEMSSLGNTNFQNPLKELEKAKLKIKDAAQRQDQLEKQNQLSQKDTVILMDQMKKLKQENMLAKNNKRSTGGGRKKGRTNNSTKRKEMAPQKVMSTRQMKFAEKEGSSGSSGSGGGSGGGAGGGGAGGGAGAGAAAVAVDTTPQDVPVGWKTLSDPVSGRTYYANAQTKETSWTKPVGAGAGNAKPKKATTVRKTPSRRKQSSIVHR